MNLNQWALKWGVPFDAVEDLRAMMGAIDTDPKPKTGMSEAAVASRVRLEASKKGLRLWRNNVGAFKAESGQWVRYGLCNESKELNRNIKSSDLIGIRPVLIHGGHVGMTIGQFVARETKPETWTYSATEHEEAQLNFLNLVLSLGGDAGFTTKEGSL